MATKGVFSSKAGLLNFVYSAGASVVILGALFKINHWHIGPLTGTWVLAIGLIVEAFIFLVFAFDTTQIGEDYAWENVYPELLDKETEAKPRKTLNKEIEMKELEISLSQKLDKMLADAKLDVGLFERLRMGIDNFSNTVDDINNTVDLSTATSKYNDQLVLASNHMESMNALYKLQLEHGKSQFELRQKYIENINQSGKHTEKFNEQLTSLTASLGSLNKVYGGMLSAMKG